MKRIKMKFKPSNEKGFDVTIARLEDEEGYLPPITEELKSSLEEWRSTYRQLDGVRELIRSGESTRLGNPRVITPNGYECTNRVKEQLNKWLNYKEDSRWESLQKSLVSIATQLKKHNECIPVLIDTENINLRRFPWQEWDLFKKFNWQAEFVLRVKSEGDEDIQPPRKRRKVRILVVVGGSDGIRTEDDLKIIQKLKEKRAEVIPLIQPTSQELCHALLDEKGYHIFIFTGHSSSLPNGQIGWIDVNEKERLSIDEFKIALKTAIDKGLQLAIFNSCDGLGLANELAKLNLPRSIVMREPIPDEVAVEFLKYFFKNFTENKSLFESVHEARKHLEHFHIPRESEKFYPGVMWLPTICIRQSALDQPLTWQDMLKQLPVSLSLLASQLPGIATGFVTGCFVTWLFLVYYHLAKPTYSTPQQHSINTDGSSTVFPITNEVAKEYQVDGENKPEIPIHFSGTTSGFKKFCTGETDINNASRPILKTEMETCKANGVNYIELPIGYDPLTVVVNSENNWINSITINELKKIWEPQAEGKVKNWSQVRLNLPDKPLYLFGPGSDSGTFDFFTAETVGQARVTRKDYDGREDDGVVVEKVISKSPFALAYFGYHYYLQNSNKLKALAIDSGSGAIKPSPETVRNHSYPLTRPLFIYVNAESAKKRSEVRDFVKYYINNAKNFVEKVGYVPLPDRLYSKVLTHFEENKVGTVFDGKLQFNIDIEEFLQKKAEF